MNTRKFTGDMADQIEKDRDELIELRAKCERLEAQSAQMREALEWVATFQNLFEGNRNTLKTTLENAISTTAGTAILARLEEARRLLCRDDWHHNQSSWDEFQSRRDVWLNGGI